MASATTFVGLVNLLRAAENALIKAGQTDPADRACTLRGVFYGTDWSRDYQVESQRTQIGARVRNIGFITYTGGNVPADPRPALGNQLFADLQGSQSIHDQNRGYGIDIGHVLIGLETRNSQIMREVQLAGQGGTGIEVVTWLGDLGGGAASLAFKRATASATLIPRVDVIFNNSTSDYGVMDNIEGDIGGYLVACGSQPGGPPVYPDNAGITDVIASYLPVSSLNEWSSRATRFATALGASIAGAKITNASAMIDQLTTKLYDFAVWYAATRWIPSGELRGDAAVSACKNLNGAAREVATVFVSALSTAVAGPTRPVQASGPYPPPSPAGECNSVLLKAAGIDISAVRKQLDDWRKDFRGLFP